MLVDLVYLLFSGLKHHVAQRQRAMQAAEGARRDRYASWQCPDCGQSFSPEAQYVNFAADQILYTARGPFTNHVIITCQRCGLFNVFDPLGNSLYECGEFVGDRAATWTNDRERNVPLGPTV